MYGMVNLDDLRIEQLPDRLKEIAALAQREADLSFAGRELGRLRQEARIRPPATSTGKVFGRRARVGMFVLLPSGQIGRLTKALRGTAFVTWTDPRLLRPEQHAALQAGELRPFKLPAAVVLGGAKKGIQEKKSIRKLEAARRNGTRPPRVGSRRRGRPPSNVVHQLDHLPDGPGAR